MIILGTLGVASKKLINRFLDRWWNFDPPSYNKYHKKFAESGEVMVRALKYNDPLIYQFILIELEDGV